MAWWLPSQQRGMAATTRDDHWAALGRERCVAQRSSGNVDSERFIAVVGFGSWRDHEDPRSTTFLR
ncbi:hypothetical protein SESBI_12174 [Sesbania bispinosa]|nr:hypothetical protein SESBI_12174 [Sesbania bispinosa]